MTDTLPRWDVTPFFPSLDSREFVGHPGGTGRRPRSPAIRFDELGIRGGDRREVTDADVAAVDEVVPALNELLDQMRLASAFLYAHVSTDARDDGRPRCSPASRPTPPALSTLTKRLQAWVATFGADALVARSTVAADHAFPLRRAEAAAAHQMSEDEEDLASELALTGGRAWAKLHGDLTSRLTATVRRPGADLRRCR